MLKKYLLFFVLLRNDSYDYLGEGEEGNVAAEHRLDAMESSQNNAVDQQDNEMDRPEIVRFLPIFFL